MDSLSGVRRSVNGNKTKVSCSPYSQDWYSPDIEVMVRHTHTDSGLCGQTGVVRGVTPGMCSVFLPDEDRTVSIAPDHLAPVQPARNDKVKVIMGELE